MRAFIKALFLPVMLCFLILTFFACTNSEEPAAPESDQAKTEQTPEEPDTPINTYDITFIVDGNSYTVATPEGSIPIFSDSTYKEPDINWSYRFNGWDRELVPATENTSYTAQYTKVERALYVALFRYNDGKYSSIDYVFEGETPEPPEISSVYKTETTEYTFKGWSLSLEPVTEDFFNANSQDSRLVYDALYDSRERLYNVNFTINSEIVYSDQLPYGATPEYKGEGIDIPDGYRYVGWSGYSEITKDDMSFELMFTYNDPEQLEWAYTMDLLSFSSSSTANDNGGNVIGEAGALLYMALEVRSAPNLTYAAKYRDRAVESLRFMVSDSGSAPYFDLQPYWCYANLTAAIAICHDTPEIWDNLTEEEKEKYDIIMRSFAYILTFGTADGNNYSTGPGLIGNFGKNWNPNYRLANVLPMLFVARYFGGADNVNSILLAFDYDKAIADFSAHKCFTRAYKRWTTKITDSNGNPIINPETGEAYPDASYFLENGGPAYIFTENSRLSYSGVSAGGSGVGVRTNYLYCGYNLDQISEILSVLIKYTYSGGTVFSDSEALGDDGIYPSTALNPLLAGTSKAYILDGTKSPVEGLPGLMLEFNSGDGGNIVNNQNTSVYNGKNIRSSASYNLHNFIMLASAISALESLGVYDLDSEENESVYKLMWVGTTDFIYKLEHGYMSYSLGSGYESHEGTGSDSYFAWKAWWNISFADNDPYKK